jgi:hypothetical protein
MDMQCTNYAPLRCIIKDALRDVSIFTIIPPTRMGYQSMPQLGAWSPQLADFAAASQRLLRLAARLA